MESGKTPFLTTDELKKIGYKIAIYPGSVMMSATKAAVSVLETLKRDGTTQNNMPNMAAFPELNEIVGVKKQRDLEATFYR